MPSSKLLTSMLQLTPINVECYSVRGMVRRCVSSRKDKQVYRYKGFDSAQCGDSMSVLEGMVNAWMEAERPRIRHVCQTMRGDHILLSFVYEDTRELEQRLAAPAHVSRFFDDDYTEERPTNPQIPIISPHIQAH